MEKRKNIFIVTEYIGFNHNSTAYYWAKIALYLNNFFDVVVICPYNKSTNSFFKEYSVKVEFVKDIGVDKNKIFSRILGQVNFAFFLNWRLARLVKSGQVVMTGTNPIISVFLTAIIKRVMGFRWIVVCHDILPDNLVPSGVFSKGWIFSILNNFFSRVYRSPDIVAPIGRDMAEKLIEKGVRSDKIAVVSNWADHKKIFPTPKSESSIIGDLGWQGNIVFCFFGNLGRTQGISDLLDAIKYVRTSEARFLFIGDGAEDFKVKRFVETIGKKNCFYFGRLDLEKNNLGLNSTDISIVSLSKGMYGLGVPSKAYFSMAANKPILLISDEGSELELLLRDFKLGWFCKSGNPKALSEKIDEICSTYDPRRTEFSPRKTLIENFSEEESLRKYSEIVLSLMVKHRFIKEKSGPKSLF